MSNNLSLGGVQIFDLSVASINLAFIELQSRIDELRGLRGRALVHDRLRADSPSEAHDALTNPFDIGGGSLAGALPVANGGTGLTTYTIGDLLYASASATLARLADVAALQVLVSGGVGVAPAWSALALASAYFANQGTATTVLHGNAAGNPAWSAVSLTADVTGTLPAANGGTGGNFTCAAGVWTASLTNAANLDASTAYEGQYLRIGNTVVCSGRVDVDPTLAATVTQLGISLPVSANFGAAEDAGGVAFASGIAGQGAAIRADVANDRLDMIWVSTDITNQPMYFTATYQVI